MSMTRTERLKLRLAALGAALTLNVAGIGLLWYSAGFLPALGVFLAMWGNNITNSIKYGEEADV